MDITSFKQKALDLEAKVKALDWKRILLYSVIGCGVLGVGVFTFNRFFPTKPIVNTPIVTPEASAVVKVPKIIITGPKKLVVYNKPQLQGATTIPPDVANNPNNQYTSSGQIPIAPYGGTAIGFTNMSTGVSRIIVSVKERPLFGFGGKTQVGVLGGISTKGSVGIAYVGQDIVRIGVVNLGVAGGGGIIGTDALAGAVINLHGEF